MAKTSSEYWQHRFTAVEAMNHNKSLRVTAEIAKQFEKAEQRITEQLNAWYQRFADNNQISLIDAKKLLTTKELKELKWDIEDYIKYGENNALDGLWVKELENASAKFHVSRLEALNLRARQEAEKAFGYEKSALTKHLADSYTDDYYRTAFEIQKGLGVGSTIGTVDAAKLDKLLNKPWTSDGMTFSDRIWRSKGQLLESLSTEMTQMCILGKAPDEAIRNISHIMGVGRGQAGRLVMTETAYFGSEAQRSCFNDLGVERYEVVATLDDRTSDTCQSMDGQVFKMSEFKPGVTAPPFHVNCRSTTCPFFDDEFTADETRAARNGDGITYEVPADMKYSEWKSRFVGDGNLVDYMGQPKRFKNDMFNIKAYMIDGTTNIYAQTHSGDSQNTIDFISKMQNSGEIRDVSEIVVGRDLQGIAAYDHTSNTLYVNEKLTNASYLEAQLNGYFVAENEVDVIKHEMFHKRHWDYILEKGGNSDIIKNEIEHELHKYVAEQITNDLQYIRKNVSANAHEGFKRNSLNELIAEVMLQKEKGLVKDEALYKLVRGCVK